jgi:hypothetical protein
LPGALFLCGDLECFVVAQSIDVPSVGASVGSGVDEFGVAIGVALFGEARGVATFGVAGAGVPAAQGVALTSDATGVAACTVGAPPGVALGVDKTIVGMMTPLVSAAIGVETGVLVVAGGVHSMAFSRDRPDGPPATIIPISALPPIAKSTTSQRVRFTSCSRRQIAYRAPLLSKTMPRRERCDIDAGFFDSRYSVLARQKMADFPATITVVGNGV